MCIRDRVSCQTLVPDENIRSSNASYTPNGKGLDVSFALKKFGVDSVALGFFAGFTGRFIVDETMNMGCLCRPVWTDGITTVSYTHLVRKTYDAWRARGDCSSPVIAITQAPRFLAAWAMRIRRWERPELEIASKTSSGCIVRAKPTAISLTSCVVQRLSLIHI